MEQEVKKEKEKVSDFSGVVVSDKMDKTRVVEITTRALHPLYKKYVVKTKRMKIHDEQNISKMGDLVDFSECKHISKDKFCKLDRVVKPANGRYVFRDKYSRYAKAKHHHHKAKKVAQKPKKPSADDAKANEEGAK